MAIYDYRIGAGHNVALGSLVNIENITPSGDVAFYAPEVFGSYTEGVTRIRGDGSVFHAGFPSQVWRFLRLTRAQYAYLRDTYCSGNYDGLVTIYTRVGKAETYARYNARIIVPQPSEMQRNFTLYQADIRFVRMVAL